MPVGVMSGEKLETPERHHSNIWKLHDLSSEYAEKTLLQTQRQLITMPDPTELDSYNASGKR